MTKEQMKNFKPTPEMIRAAENCFAAMAFTETIRPIVEAYQKRILEEMQAPLAKEWQERKLAQDEPIILDIRHTYLMEDCDFQTYLARTREEQAKAGLHTDSPDHCPLLVAESLQMEAEHCLIDAMVPVTGITRDMIFQSAHSLENLKKFLDINLRFMAGFCDTKGTMKRFGIAA
jgi:hypothetical protein